MSFYKINQNETHQVQIAIEHPWLLIAKHQLMHLQTQANRNLKKMKMISMISFNLREKITNLELSNLEILGLYSKSFEKSKIPSVPLL